MPPPTLLAMSSSRFTLANYASGVLVFTLSVSSADISPVKGEKWLSVKNVPQTFFALKAPSRGRRF